MLLSAYSHPSEGTTEPDGMSWPSLLWPDVATGSFEATVPGAATAKAAAPLANVLFLQEAGDASAISVNDLHQGGIGDCFLISAMGELALTHPDAIRGMIHANANGTETVTLYQDKSGRLPGFGSTALKPVQVTVDNLFPRYSVNNGAGQDVVGNQKEIWAQVLEKSVAALDGGYDKIAHGGNPVVAMEELTGHSAFAMSASSLTLDALKGYMAAGDLITMDTPGRSGLPFDLVGGHAYMFEKLVMSGSTPMVQLGNPWGSYQPQLIPFAQLSKGIAEVDVGRFA